MKKRRLAPVPSSLCVLASALFLQAVTRAQDAPPVAAAPPAPPPVVSTFTCEQMEAFLKAGKVLSQKTTSVGITAPTRAMLDDGKMKHEASLQTVDIRKTSFEGSRGTELNFRDAWQFNVAGYELAKMLKLNMVPPYVERRVSGKDGSLSWWISDAMMEKDRYQKKLQPPHPMKWNEQLFAARIFHELIADTDFNMTNVLITKDWRIWMIDFSRAFRMGKTINNPKQLTKADRTMLAAMRALTAEGVQQALGRWLNKPEMEGLMARRDQIVEFFDKEIAAKGEVAILYDLPRTSEVCGAGLQ
jgi:hypothetical protein